MTTSPTTERVRFIEHQGIPVILLDFEKIVDTDEGVMQATRAKDFFARLPANGSHLSLTDVRGSRYDRKVLEALKDLTAHNRPYVRAAAVVSTSAFHKAAVSIVALFSGRKLQVFSSRDEALDYLVAEHRAATGSSGKATTAR